MSWYLKWSKIIAMTLLEHCLQFFYPKLLLVILIIISEFYVILFL